MNQPLPARNESGAWPPLETNEQLRVYAQPDIEHVLKEVSEKGAVVTAYFERGREFALTSIVGLSLEARTMFFEPGPDEDINRRWLSSASMLFMTNQGEVRIKFAGRSIAEVSYRGERTFRVPMPPFLVRLQRREYFRIATSMMDPIICHIPVRGHEQDAQAVIMDISVGGVALMDNHVDLEFEPGSVYPRCWIDLPLLGIVRTGLEVCNFSEVNLRNGLVARRAGCRFVDLSRAAENLVQRYIMSLELKKEMRAK